MDRLGTTDVWELEVELWPRAAEKGLRPVRMEPGNFSGHAKDDSDPLWFAAYTPRTFLFKVPPSRADWWSLVNQTPWMIGYEDDKALIDSNNWPMIDWMKKSGSVKLVDSEGREAGRISVSRSTAYVNKGYERTTCITYDIIDSVCNRRTAMGETYPAKDAVRAAEYKLLERLSLLDYVVGESDIKKVIRDYLEEIGMKPGARKTKGKAKV